MSILSSFFASEPPRTYSGSLSDLEASSGGARVTPSSALTYSAVYSGVRLLSDAIAMFPKHVIREDDRERNKGHQVSVMLARETNPHSVPFIVFRQLMCQAIVLGRSGAVIQWQDGRPKYLWPLNNPRALQPQIIEGQLVYYYPTQIFERRNFLWPHELVYLPSMGFDGRVGLGLIDVARHAIGLGLSAERSTAAFYDQGMRLGGILATEQELSPEAIQRIRKQVEDNQAGVEHHHKMLVLEKGLSYEATVGALKDAENLDQRRHAVVDMCRFLGVPPPLLHALENAHFNNTTELKQMFLQFSLLSWITLFEQEFSRKLLIGNDRGDYFVEFITENFARMDQKARYEAYAKAIASGWMSINDIRRRENMPLIPAEEGGDDYLRPLNMTVAGSFQHQARFIAEVAQKLQTAVGKTLDRDEARAIIEKAGAILSPAPKLPGEIAPEDGKSSLSALPQLESQVVAAEPLFAAQLERLGRRLRASGDAAGEAEFIARAIGDALEGFAGAVTGCRLPGGYVPEAAGRLAGSILSAARTADFRQLAGYELRRAAWCAWCSEPGNRAAEWIPCGCGGDRSEFSHPPLSLNCHCQVERSKP